MRLNKLNVAVLCAILTVLNTGCAQRDTGVAANTTVAAEPRAGQLPLGVTPSRYDIDVKVDPGALSFEGAVKTTIEVHEPTKVITLNAVGLTIDSAALSQSAAITAASPEAGAEGSAAKAASPAVAPIDIALNEQAETASFTFADSLQPGVHTLTIRYHGTFTVGGRGIYAVDSETPEGKSRMVKTFFAPGEFRRFVPCWDEAQMRAVFALSVTAPAQRMVISNTMLQTQLELPGGWQKVTFLPTPRMDSIYLGIGDWERVTRQVDGIEIGLVVPRGYASRTGFALTTTSELLKYYNEYFGVKYPFAKLDFISSLGGGGGVSNWGAIAMGANSLLLDPATSSSAERQEAFGLIAHEMAHQWFGNLLNPSRWEEVWLSEGFATWMENAAVEALRPQWRPWLQFSGSADDVTDYSLDGAMAIDGRSSSHPIVDPSADTAATVHADPISYQKSAAVIRMLAAYLGPEAFRAGIRRYMQEHQYGDPGTRDVLTALERVSGRPVIQMGEEFLKQTGLPLLVVSESAGGGVVLRQERFGADAAARSPQVWHVPVTLRSVDGRISRQTVVSGSAPQELKDLQLPLIVNADRLAYARTQYSAPAFRKLVASFARLPAADQLTLLSDSWALATAGYVPIDNLLDLLAALPSEANPLVWSKAVGAAAQVAKFLAPGRQRAAFLVFARGRLSPQLQRLGWDPRPEETDNAARLRIELIDALSELDDPAVVAEAQRLFAAAGGDPAKLASAKGEAVVRAVGAHADDATFSKLEQMAQRAPDPLTRGKYYHALSSAKDPALAARALQLAARFLQSAQGGVVRGVDIIASVARHHPDLAWQFAVAHHEEVSAEVDSMTRRMIFPILAAYSTRAERSQELGSFAAKFLPPEWGSHVAKARSKIEESAQLASRFTPQVGLWLSRSSMQP